LTTEAASPLRAVEGEHNIDRSRQRTGRKEHNILFWGRFGIFSGSKDPEATWRFLKYSYR
jgi:hypothetical protein